MGRENQQMRSGQVRQAILDAALEIALEEGFEGLSVRKISARKGYSTGVVYYHFKDKENIIEELQAQKGRELRALVEAAVVPGQTVCQTLRQVYHSICLLAHTRAAEYNLVLRQRQRQDGQGGTGGGEMQQMLAALLRQGMEAGEIEKEDPDVLAFAVWSSFIGFNLNISRMPQMGREELEALFAVQMDMVLRGIARQKNAPQEAG